MNQPTPQETNAYFFLVAALVIYEKDGAQKQRHLNVLAEMDQPNVTKQCLADIQRSVLQRLNAENNVTPDMVRDIVLLNISLLGLMPPNTFHDTPEAALDAPAQGTA